MRNRFKLKAISLFLVLLISISLFCFTAFGSRNKILISSHLTETKPDLIVIDSMSQLCDLEKPAVLFQHDKHTEALARQNKDCTTCHLFKEEKISPEFLNTTQADCEAQMNIYHNNCINCHKEQLETGDKSGPMVCGECHIEKPDITSERQPVEMDKSLHYRHIKKYDNKCETCHHSYDEKTKKLFYAKGKEESCRYCHKEKTVDNRISMKQASHTACVSCHLKTQEQKKETGPVKCSGCHDIEQQKKIKKLTQVPRMQRNQPDVALIKTGDKKLDAPGKVRMDFVPFNHKSHEQSENNCRVCHHESLEKCSKCHTQEGVKEGNFVTLEQAMHSEKNNQSCNGCHHIKQKDTNCSGCHFFLSKQNQNKDTSCLLCHMKPPSDSSASDEKILTEKMINSRAKKNKTYNEQDIPKTVVIKLMSNKYEPAEFPHRLIVKTLLKSMKGNTLSGYFHSEEGTLCQGCHHNSPAANKPPACVSCHGVRGNENDLFKPGIMGAYHIQCIGCHREIKIDKTSCTDCHKKKAK